MTPSSTLLGFNNNVRHRGRIFHIQTEDSGAKYPRIVTHLFADGGRIIKTTRTDYAEHVGSSEMAKVVQALMKEQHKAMFIALRAGELDELVDQVVSAAESGAPTSAATSSSLRAVPRSASSNPQAGPVSARPSARSPRKRGAKSEPPRPVVPGRYAAARPPAIFSDPAPGRSLFSDGLISEKSLDEVILSYLADDLDVADNK
ncbi:MAG TPA: hypothetical protein VF989_19200 [Polyangiaceae bacterium]|jgi:hypothetical protein